MVIFAVTDSRNASPGNVAPIVIGLAACLGFILDVGNLLILVRDMRLETFQR